VPPKSVTDISRSNCSGGEWPFDGGRAHPFSDCRGIFTTD
jgi:hypothetical protein